MLWSSWIFKFLITARMNLRRNNYSKLKLEFGLVVFPVNSSHVVHNCSAMCLRDLILAVIVPAVTNHRSPFQSSWLGPISWTSTEDGPSHETSGELI